MNEYQRAWITRNFEEANFVDLDTAICRCPVCAEASSLAISFDQGHSSLGCSRGCSTRGVLERIGWNTARLEALGRRA